MPIPKPNKGENQSDFVSRCIPKLYPEYNDEQQSAAICIKTYEDSKMNMSSVDRVSLKISGINLLAGLDDACWDGYEAIGLKDDGSPNCVPIAESK
jgi:hypothetical protein